MIIGSPELELVAPVDLNIVCFCYANRITDEAELKALNTELMPRVQESGIAIPFDTTLAGKHCLRVAINNHRTQRQDLGLFLTEVLRIGDRLGQGATSPS